MAVAKPRVGEVAMRKSPKTSLSTRHNLQSWMYGGSITTAPYNNLATLCARFLDGRASTSSSVILLNLGLSPCWNTSLQVNSQSFPGGPSTDTRSSQTQFVALAQTTRCTSTWGSPNLERNSSFGCSFVCAKVVRMAGSSFTRNH